MKTLATTILSTVFFVVIFIYFAGPWIIAERRNCRRKKIIKIGTIVVPLIMLFPAASFSGWLFYIPTLILYIGSVFDKKAN